MFGKTSAEMVEEAIHIDPATVANPRDRELLEAIRAAASEIDLTQLPFDEMGLDDPEAGPSSSPDPPRA